MATEVFLMANIEELGAEGEIVSVSDGYARNYLIPRKLAAPATEAAKRRLAKQQKDREQVRKLQLEEAKQLVTKLEGLSVTITVKTGGKDKMFGSVTAADIVASLKQQGVDLDRHSLVLEAPIKELGVFTVKARLHPEVEASIKVWVVEE